MSEYTQPTVEIDWDAKARRQCERTLAIIRDLEYTVEPGAKILDFGCGKGLLVDAYRKLGLDAFGCDIDIDRTADPLTEQLYDQGYIRNIDTNSYRLPFPDGTFDYVISCQVLEHVQDYSTVLAELARVTKISGVGYHEFPSRYRPIEGHVYVPLASIIRHPLWLRMWALLGIRNEYQRGLTAKEAAKLNREYLTTRTNYLTKSAISRHAHTWFDECTYVEPIYLRYTRVGRKLAGLPFKSLLRLYAYVYSVFRSRAILLRSPRH